MPEIVSEIESAAEMMSKIYLALNRAVRNHGGQTGDLYRLATREGEELLHDIAQLIVEAGVSARNGTEVRDEDFLIEGSGGDQSIELETIPFQFADLENDTPNEVSIFFNDGEP